MSFNFAPWAIDGARTTAALARTDSYATGGGRSGVVQPGDLRVLPLAVPGAGVRVTSGAAVVLNHYLSDPDQAYTVSNPAIHTVLEADMPAPQPTTSYYLACVVIGDPEFNQTGHPFMPGTPLDPTEAADYEYVRVVLIPCSSSTTRFEQLGYFYPAYALARLEVPPNTSTITGPMITDLRRLANPRSDREMLLQTPAAGEQLQGEPFHDWLSYAPWIEVPTWATKVRMIVHLSSFVIFQESLGDFRVTLGPLVGVTVPYAYNDVDGGGSRWSAILSLEADVSAYAGQGLQIKIQGQRRPDFPGHVTTWENSQVMIDVQFDESPI